MNWLSYMKILGGKQKQTDRRLREKLEQTMMIMKE